MSNKRLREETSEQIHTRHKKLRDDNGVNYNYNFSIVLELIFLTHIQTNLKNNKNMFIYRLLNVLIQLDIHLEEI